MKPLTKGTWNERILVETVFSMLIVVCQAQKMAHRAWEYFCMRLSFLLALVHHSGAVGGAAA